ncbi:MAG: hypothetical protein U0R49_09655 [Fimbriimonadales bacterium]
MPIPSVSTLACAIALAQSGAQDTKGSSEPKTEQPPQAPVSSNPGISLVFDFGGDLMDHQDRRRYDFREIEFGFDSDVDPHLKAQAFVAVAKEDGETVVEVEEAFGRYGNLGRGLSAKFGKIAAAIGRVQRNHADQFDYLDYPFVTQDTLGDEGLRSVGGSISYLLPTSRFSEFTFEAVDANDGPLFHSANSGDMVLLGHYRTFFDFSEDLSAQLGATYANGPNDNERAQLYGLDYVMKWHPSSTGKSAVFETEAYWSNTGQPGDKTTFGWFASLAYQIVPRWFVTVKGDYSELPGTTDVRRGLSAGLTFKLTEFEHWRLEFQRVASNFATDKNFLSLQFQFLIGKHPAHKY